MSREDCPAAAVFGGARKVLGILGLSRRGRRLITQWTAITQAASGRCDRSPKLRKKCSGGVRIEALGPDPAFHVALVQATLVPNADTPHTTQSHIPLPPFATSTGPKDDGTSRYAPRSGMILGSTLGPGIQTASTLDGCCLSQLASDGIFFIVHVRWAALSAGVFKTHRTRPHTHTHILYQPSPSSTPVSVRGSWPSSTLTRSRGKSSPSFSLILFFAPMILHCKRRRARPLALT